MLFKGQKILWLQLMEEKEYEAKIIGADPLSDLAVLEIQSKDKFVL